MILGFFFNGFFRFECQVWGSMFYVVFVVKIPSPTPTTLTDTSASVLNSVQQDLANRRTKQGISRQDSRLSVKSLIESIENATKQAKAGKII